MMLRRVFPIHRSCNEKSSKPSRFGAWGIGSWTTVSSPRYQP
jgi:hypothetical protein